MNLNKISGGYACLPDYYFVTEKRAKDIMKGGSFNQNMAVQTRDRSYVNKRDFIFGGHRYGTRSKGKAQNNGLPDNPRRIRKQQPQAAVTPAAAVAAAVTTNFVPPPMPPPPPPPPPSSQPTMPPFPTTKTSTAGVFRPNFAAPPAPPPAPIIPAPPPLPTVDKEIELAKDNLQKARNYVEFLESQEVPKNVSMMGVLLRIRAEIKTRRKNAEIRRDEAEKDKNLGGKFFQLWKTWDLVVDQYKIAQALAIERTQIWNEAEYNTRKEEAEDQRKEQEQKARELEALAKKEARKKALDDLDLEKLKAIQEGRVLRNTQLENSIAHTKAMNTAEEQRKAAQAIRDGELHGMNMSRQKQALLLEKGAADAKKDIDSRRMKMQEDKNEAEIQRRSAEAAAKAANDLRKFNLQETKQNADIEYRKNESDKKWKFNEDKLKAANDAKKLEDARKQAAQEQKLKELENEGVARKEREAREKWDSLIMQVARAPQRRSGALEEFSRWDPINNPINSVNNNNYYNNYRPMTMENRLEQTVPPYDLPKNYPIYGGNGYYNYTNSYQPNMPSAVSMNFGRKGRTGRRTNWEKYGTPSLRTARDMIRSGILPPGYEGLRGNPASSYVSSYKPYPLPVTNAPTVDQGGYAGNYTDPGPLDALARGASAMLYGTRQFTSTPNQLFPTTIRNTTSTLPGNAYRMAGLVDSVRGQPISNAERLSNIRNYAEAAKLINDDATGFTPEQRTTAMNAVAAALPIAATAASGWGTAAKIASTGLKAIGWMGENFWPLHDSYQRFKTRRNIYNAVDKVAGFFTGRGLKRRRRRGKKHFRKGSGLHTRKLKFGGMIIPPKKLKKMFSNSKECNCKNN